MCLFYQLSYQLRSLNDLTTYYLSLNEIVEATKSV